MKDVRMSNSTIRQQARDAKPMLLSSLGQIWCLRLIALGLVLCSACFAWRSYLDMGLFMNLGTDYALYLSQSKVIDTGHPERLYDLAATDKPYRALLERYNLDPAYRTWVADTVVGPVPYPPLFAWMMRPFTWITPPVSFAIWIVLNVCVAGVLSWRLTQHCGDLDRPSVVLCFFASYPVVLTLYVGQVQLLLAWCVAECYLAFRNGKEFRAGIWLGCLLIKPQYGIFLGVLLLWKQRWAAIGGAAVAGGVWFGGSWLVAGTQAIVAYPSAFGGMAQFRGDDPTLMINWRSIILEVYPTIYGPSGTKLAMALFGLTGCALAWMWRGSWNPTSADFPVKILVTFLGTLIASFHSHPYGAVIIALPFVAVLLGQYGGKVAWVLGCTAAVTPALTFSLGYSGLISYGDVYQHLAISSKILKVVIFAMFGYYFVQVCGVSCFRALQTMAVREFFGRGAFTRVCQRVDLRWASIRRGYFTAPRWPG